MATRLRENHYRQLELIASYGKFGLAIHDPHMPRGGWALNNTLEAHGLIEYAPLKGGIVEWEHSTHYSRPLKYCTWQITRKGKRVLRERQQVFEPIRTEV